MIRRFVLLALAGLTLAGNSFLLLGEGLSFLANQYKLNQHLAQAEEVLITARDSLPWPDAGLLKTLGNFQLNGNAQSAAETFRLALAGRPLDPALWSRYSIALFYAGEYTSAARSAQLALRLAPLDFPIALEQAVIGGEFLISAPEPMRHEWRKAANFTVETNWKFARSYLIATAREKSFCKLIHPESTASSWCEQVVTFGPQCRHKDLPREKKPRECRQLGFVQAQPS